MFTKGKYKNAKVFIRVLPLEKMCWEYFKILDDERTVYVRALQDFEKGYEDRTPHYWNFVTDRIFYNSSQEEIYKTIINDDILNDVIQGNNAIILGYGQTGSGKSLTMNGLNSSYDERGIAPRLISQLFETKNNLNISTKMYIYMSYIETKKFSAVDLLNDEDIVLDANSMKNVLSIKVDNEIDALKLLFKAEGRRDVINNGIYDSNVSNGILTFEIIVNDLAHGTKKSKIHIVDLAGADTFGNITCFFKQIMEIGHANLAKTQLEQFLLILCENIYEKIVVKQRLNILINYLRESLNTSSILRFIGHVHTNFDNLRVTLSILRFSQIVQGLQFAKPLPNLEKDATEVKLPVTLERKIEQIKTDRILEEMFNARNFNLNTNIDQERINHIRNFTNEYLQDKINAIVPLSVADINVVLKVFKELYLKLDEEKKECYKNAYDKAVADLTVARNQIRKDSFGRSPSVSSKRERSRNSISQKQRKSADEATTTQLIQNDKSKTSVSSLTKKHSSIRSVKRLSVDKKRSSFGSDIATKLSATDEADNTEIPNQFPAYEDAWILFTIRDNYDYENLIENIQTAELNTKEVHKSYLSQINILREKNNVVLIRKDELFQLQLQFDLNQMHDEDLQTQFTSNVQEAERQLVEQEEVVLKCQVELRLALQMLQEAKKDLNNEFERFCMDQYKTTLPYLQQNTDNVVSNELDLKLINCEEDKMDLSCTEKFDILAFYATLQNLMRKEAADKKIRLKRNKKWNNTIKI